MTTPDFSARVDGIRAALKQAHEHVFDKEPVNVIPIRDMIDRLSSEVSIATPDMADEAREVLALQLTKLVEDLDVLERLITEHLDKGAN